MRIPAENEERIVCVPVQSLSYGAWFDGRRCVVKTYDDFSGLCIIDIEGTRVFVEPDWLIEIDPPTQRFPKPEVDDWRAWTENRPGYCPCGIKREMCDYHRS